MFREQELKAELEDHIKMEPENELPPLIPCNSHDDSSQTSQSSIEVASIEEGNLNSKINSK